MSVWDSVDVPETIGVSTVQRNMFTVGFREVDSIVVLGGPIALNPEALYDKTLEHRDSIGPRLSPHGDSDHYKGHGLIFGRVTGKPIVLPDSTGRNVPFEFFVGIDHAMGYSFSQPNDMNTLSWLGHQIPEFRDSRLATFARSDAGYAESQGLELSDYDCLTIGDLRPRYDAGWVESVILSSKQ